MKKLNFSLFFIVVSALFYSCEKESGFDNETDALETIESTSKSQATYEELEAVVNILNATKPDQLENVFYSLPEYFVFRINDHIKFNELAEIVQNLNESYIEENYEAYGAFIALSTQDKLVNILKEFRDVADLTYYERKVVTDVINVLYSASPRIYREWGSREGVSDDQFYEALKVLRSTKKSEIIETLWGLSISPVFIENEKEEILKAMFALEDIREFYIEEELVEVKNLLFESQSRASISRILKQVSTMPGVENYKNTLVKTSNALNKADRRIKRLFR